MTNLFTKRIFIIMVVVIIGAGIYTWRTIGGIGDKEKASLELAQLQSGQDQGGQDNLTGLYTNNTYHFSLRYPTNFTVNDLVTNEGNNVIMIEGKGENEQFQILVSAFDENEPLTQERIERDLPDFIIEEPRAITISGAPALIFWSEDEVLGKTREVWFTHKEALFQVSAPAVFDQTLSQVMATWSFN